MENNKKLLKMGSVKDIYACGEDNLVFQFSDRFSIFDWGEMPDLLNGKGKSLANMTEKLFTFLGDKENWKNWDKDLVVSERYSNTKVYERLITKGLKHHFLKKISDDEVLVKKVDVLKPHIEKNNGKEVFNYEIYKKRPIGCLVPLEVVFRFGITDGSSLLDRVEDKSYLDSIGLIETPKVGDQFGFPIIEFSTKLEPSDKYIKYEMVKEIAGLNDFEFNYLHQLTSLLALRLKDYFNEYDIDLIDGKFEFSFADLLNFNDRDFQLVDAIGPDELRLSYKGKRLSKEILRQYYKDSKWYGVLSTAKNEAKKRGLSDWKTICLDEHGCRPEKLDTHYKEKVEQMYQCLGTLFQNPDRVLVKNNLDSLTEVF